MWYGWFAMKHSNFMAHGVRSLTDYEPLTPCSVRQCNLFTTYTCLLGLLVCYLHTVSYFCWGLPELRSSFWYQEASTPPCQSTRYDLTLSTPSSASSFNWWLFMIKVSGLKSLFSLPCLSYFGVMAHVALFLSWLGWWRMKKWQTQVM